MKAKVRPHLRIFAQRRTCEPSRFQALGIAWPRLVTITPMRLSLLALSLVTMSCGQPLYEATAPDTIVTQWSHGEVTGERTELPPQTLTTPDGAELVVAARVATLDGARVPVHIEVALSKNPAEAEVTATCRPPMHFDGDPPDLRSTDCMVSEMTGTESWLGSKRGEQATSIIRVGGDGTVELR